MDKAEIRLQCLELASRLGMRDPSVTKAVADDYFDWVTAGDKPRKAPRSASKKEAADKAKAPAETAGETAAT